MPTKKLMNQPGLQINHLKTAKIICFSLYCHGQHKRIWGIQKVYRTYCQQTQNHLIHFNKNLLMYINLFQINVHLPYQRYVVFLYSKASNSSKAKFLDY
jgi:hypothetical protein